MLDSPAPGLMLAGRLASKIRHDYTCSQGVWGRLKYLDLSQPLTHAGPCHHLKRLDPTGTARAAELPLYINSSEERFFLGNQKPCGMVFSYFPKAFWIPPAQREQQRCQSPAPDPAAAHAAQPHPQAASRRSVPHPTRKPWSESRLAFLSSAAGPVGCFPGVHHALAPTCRMQLRLCLITHR